MDAICKDVMDNHRAIVIAAFASSPQYEEASIKWLELLHRRALKEAVYFEKKYQEENPLYGSLGRCAYYECLIAAKTYVSWIPELLENLRAKQNGCCGGCV